MNRSVGIVLGALVVILILASLALFTVDQRQNAIVFRLGEPVHVITKPGLYFKIPLLDNVRFFDVRLLTERFLAERFPRGVAAVPRARGRTSSTSAAAAANDSMEQRSP